MKKLYLLLALPLFFTACSLDNTIPTGPSPEIIIPIDEEATTPNLPEEITDELPIIDGQTYPNNLDAELAELFMAKYGYTFDQVEVTISQYDLGGFAKGMVSLDGGGPGNEGGFLAALSAGNWVLVWDGNGMWDCPVIRDYNFPADMTEECYP